MNRRAFIKAAVPAVAIPAVAITCKYEDDEKGPEKESKNCNWPYRVYCYDRKHGEDIFSKVYKGCFAPEREYMSFDEEEPNGYMGFMYDSILRFMTLDDATEFIEIHVRAKGDLYIRDTIYDVYYCNDRHLDRYTENVADELHVAHYWYNGDTGRNIHWVAEQPYINWLKVEMG